MRTDRIEVAQAGDPPEFLGACSQVVEQAFRRCFGVPVGIDRLDRRRFRNRHVVGVAVEGGAAAEHKGVAAVVGHHLQQAERAVHIHVPVAQRFSNRFAHGLESCEVDHRINRLALRSGLLEDRLKAGGIADVPFDKLQAIRRSRL